jgi:enoyl-CoA hydratase
MATDAVRYELVDRIGVIRLDDGKVNALSFEVIAAIGAAFDRAEPEAAAVVLIGRAGRFSGGFDLATMRQGPGPARALVTAGAELALRLYAYPLPVIAACTGHALAMGGFLLLASDVRIGASGDFKLGFNEVAIGLTVPRFGVELGLERLSVRHHTRALVTAEIYDPVRACDAGILDRVVAPDAVLEEAMSEARRLATLSPIAYRGTKQKLRAATIARIRAEHEADMDRLAEGR